MVLKSDNSTGACDSPLNSKNYDDGGNNATSGDENKRNITFRKYTEEEDAIILNRVAEWGGHRLTDGKKMWASIALELKDRSARGVANRWHRIVADQRMQQLQNK